MTKPLLIAESLRKSFNTTNGNLPTVDKISFKVNEGEFLCIVGPSGCGKTTLLQMLAGLELPDSGKVILERTVLEAPHPHISLVFQKSNLMPWRTVLQNVQLPLQLHGKPAKETQKIALKMLSRVGLVDFANAYPSALSGGMEQRVAIARALVQKPRVLLLDEPFGALDSLTRERLNLELLSLWRHQNITAIMVTHNIREAVLLADRVLVLSSRPASISSEFIIDLPRPRHQNIEYTPEFVDLSYRIRRAIKD